MPTEDDLYEKLRLELRRGSLILAVLGALKEERYGYTLRKVLSPTWVWRSTKAPSTPCSAAWRHRASS